MSRDALDRRDFLKACARLGLAGAALAALPKWAQSAPPTGPRRTPPMPPVSMRQPDVANADILVRNEHPEHWESTLRALDGHWLTPTDRFFVRSHFGVPATMDVRHYRLEVAGKVTAPLSLTLAEVRRLPVASAAHTLECAGNGRGLYPLANTSGTQWERGAVGNARWRGTRLANLLQRAGVATDAKHVWFECADKAPYGNVPPFLRSIPIEKAMDDVLVAWDMNDAPLVPIHGAPLRVVTPGWFGMASAKWVTRIRLEAEPSDNQFMLRGYRYNAPGQDPAAAAPVEALRVKSLITHPREGSWVGPGPIAVGGFAWAGTPRVARVELSDDGGTTWRAASLAGPSEPYAWRAWTATIPKRPAGDLTIMARATDDAGATQPLAATPNAGGYGNNSVHAVRVHVQG